MFTEAFIERDMEKPGWEHGPPGGVLRGFLEAVHEAAVNGEPVVYEGRQLLGVDLEACLDYMADYAAAIGKWVRYPYCSGCLCTLAQAQEGSRIQTEILMLPLFGFVSSLGRCLSQLL